ICVGDGALMVGRSRSDELSARLDDSNPKWRRREVNHQLGTRVRAPAHRAVRAPHVLAHLHREGPKIERENTVSKRNPAMQILLKGNTSSEVPAFVKDVVSGELLFRNQAPDA